jgi:hypothetical protein
LRRIRPRCAMPLHSRLGSRRSGDSRPSGYRWRRSLAAGQSSQTVAKASAPDDLCRVDHASGRGEVLRRDRSVANGSEGISSRRYVPGRRSSGSGELPTRWRPVANGPEGIGSRRFVPGRRSSGSGELRVWGAPHEVAIRHELSHCQGQPAVTDGSAQYPPTGKTPGRKPAPVSTRRPARSAPGGCRGAWRATRRG